jgi:hypothetical protein
MATAPIRYVYIASPYTIGDKEVNVRKSIDAADQIKQGNGLIPFVPLLCHYWDAVHAHSYDYWADMMLEWVKRCDYVLRLPGDSWGADREVELAQSLAIPVFYSVDKLIEYSNSWSIVE